MRRRRSPRRGVRGIGIAVCLLCRHLISSLFQKRRHLFARGKERIQSQQSCAARSGQLALVITDDVHLIRHVLEGMKANLVLNRSEDDAIGLG